MSDSISVQRVFKTGEQLLRPPRGYNESTRTPTVGMRMSRSANFKGRICTLRPTVLRSNLGMRDTGARSIVTLAVPNENLLSKQGVYIVQP